MATPEEIQGYIRTVAAQKGVPPRVALAVARQESNFNPNAIGDNGASVGLFQLQKAAASEAGLTPQDRHDWRRNVEGGVEFLKQKIAQSGGDIPAGVKRYNGGGDPNYVSNVAKWLTTFVSPREAAAATLDTPAPRQNAEQTPAQDDLAARVKARLQAKPDAATGGEQAQPEASLEDRVMARLKLGRAATSANQPVPEAAPEGFNPQAPTMKIDIGQQGDATPTPAQPSAREQAQAAMTEQLAEIDRSAAGFSSVSATPEELAAHRKQLPAMVVGGVLGGGGAMLGAKVAGAVAPALAPVGGFLGEVFGNIAARTANVKAGLEEPGLAGDVGMVAAPFVSRAVPMARGLVKTTKAGRAITTAETTNAANQAAYAEAQAAAQAAAAEKNAAQQATYAAGESQAQAQAAEKNRGILAGHRQATQQAEATAAAQNAANQQAYAEAEAAREAAISAQSHAVTTAQQIPEMVAPVIPSKKLYADLRSNFGDLPVSSQPLRDVVAETLGTAKTLPPRFERLASELENLDPTVTFGKIHEYIKEFGPLTRNQDPEVRRYAHALLEGANRTLEEAAARDTTSAVARKDLLAAVGSYKREKAVELLSTVANGATRSTDEGYIVISPGKLLTNFDKQLRDDPFLAKSIGAEEAQQVRGAFATLTTTPKIRNKMAPPETVQPKYPEPAKLVEAKTSLPPEPVMAKAVPVPEHVEPELRKLGFTGEGIKGMSAESATAGLRLLGLPIPHGAGVLAVVGVDAASQVLAKAMLSPRIRPKVIALMHSTGGELNPMMVGAIRAAISAEEGGTSVKESAQ